MKKSWTTTKLIVAGSLGALLSLIMVLGGLLAASTGFLGASAAVGIFAESTILAITPLFVSNFGSSFLTGLIFGILVLPLPVMGPPGFILKILVGSLMGLGADMIYLLVKKNNYTKAVLSGAITQVIIAFLLWIFAIFLDVKGSVPKIFLTLPGLAIGIVMEGLLGCIGGFLAWKIYQKIKNTSVVKRIQGE